MVMFIRVKLLKFKAEKKTEDFSSFKFFVPRVEYNRTAEARR